MSDTQEPKPPEPVYSVFVRGNLQDTMPYAPAWTLKDGVHLLVTHASAVAYAEALAAHRVAQERERTYTRAQLLAAIQAERHACSIAVWMTLQDALAEGADDKGIDGWMREAEQRIKTRIDATAHNRQPPEPGKEN